MRTLIITSGNGDRFGELRNFVASLRANGRYEDAICICDNAIGGTWDKPGTWRTEGSFAADQLEYLQALDVIVCTLQELIDESGVDESTIRAIRSPTQRYPYKFLYNTLISRRFLGKCDRTFYFDSDIYFQRPIAPLIAAATRRELLIVREWRKMREGPFLPRWLAFSDFSKVSNQNAYLDEMLNADNFCSGFFGGHAEAFHRLNLLCLLLASNRFVDFYSDQPLINVAKTFFGVPFKEVGFDLCLHLGELERGEYDVVDGCFQHKGVVPICVHFNSGKYGELQAVLDTGQALPHVPPSPLERLRRKVHRYMTLLR